MSFFDHPLVIVNPSAGHGRAAALRTEVELYWRQQGFAAEFCVPGSREEARTRARTARAAGYSCVIVMGGDGTAHEVINGLRSSPIPLGLVPAGGGNDLARALDIPADPLEAAHALLHARIRRMDLLRLCDSSGQVSLYAGAGGAGIDAEAAQLANTRFRRFPGMTRYLAAAVSAFREARPLEVRLTADGAPCGFTAHLIAVANAPSYGGGILIAPEARIDDGWMDLAMVAPLRWTQLLDGMLLALRSGDIRWPEMQRMRARAVRIETDRPVTFHGDGEPLGVTPVDIEVLPAALEVLVPR